MDDSSLFRKKPVIRATFYEKGQRGEISIRLIQKTGPDTSLYNYNNFFKSMKPVGR